MKQKIKALFAEFVEIRFSAAGLAFSTLLSLIPFLIVVVAIFQSIIGLDEFYPRIEKIIFMYLREATGGSVSHYVRGSLQNVNVSALGYSGALFLLWTSFGLIRNIDYIFNKIWKIEITRPLYKRLLLYWLILLAVPIALAILAAVRSIDFFQGVSRHIEHEFVFAVSAIVFLSTMYKIIPDTKVNRWAAIASAGVAGVSLAVVQNSFLWISVKLFKQNTIYGSLASFPIFLLWLLIVWIIVLSGVRLCAFFQQRWSKKA